MIQSMTLLLPHRNWVSLQPDLFNLLYQEMSHFSVDSQSFRLVEMIKVVLENRCEGVLKNRCLSDAVQVILSSEDPCLISWSLFLFWRFLRLLLSLRIFIDSLWPLLLEVCGPLVGSDCLMSLKFIVFPSSLVIMNRY